MNTNECAGGIDLDYQWLFGGKELDGHYQQTFGTDTAGNSADHDPSLL